MGVAVAVNVGVEVGNGLTGVGDDGTVGTRVAFTNTVRGVGVGAGVGDPSTSELHASVKHARNKLARSMPLDKKRFGSESLSKLSDA